MHKSRYKFVKKRNKCDVIIKYIKKKPLTEKKKQLKQYKKFTQKNNKIGEREREREY